jgi:hypothetical protein
MKTEMERIAAGEPKQRKDDEAVRTGAPED